MNIPSPLSASLRDEAEKIVSLLQQSGYIAYFAGGCVRDFLMGLECHDVDIATSATPDQVMNIFPKSRAVGAHFGVVLVPMGENYFDVATFRNDGIYLDGRRPENVAFSVPEEDAQRRDFTINGLFQDPIAGEIIDFVGGQKDIEALVLRAIGNPADRFKEDALRLLRAIRFAVTKGLEIEHETWRAIVDCSDLLSRISAERIRDEFDKILLSSRRREGVELLVKTRLMKHIIPEVYDLIGCEQPPEWHPEGDVFVHTMMMLESLSADGVEPDLPLVLSTLLHDIGKPSVMSTEDSGRIRFSGHDAVGVEMSRHILKRLHYSNAIVDAVCFMVGRHMHFINVQNMREGKIRQFMASDFFEDELKLHRADCLCSNGSLDNYDYLMKRVSEHASEIPLPPRLLTGKHLINMGWTPGKDFRSILDHVYLNQLEGRITTLQEAIKFAANLREN